MLLFREQAKFNDDTEEKMEEKVDEAHLKQVKATTAEEEEDKKEVEVEKGKKKRERVIDSCCRRSKEEEGRRSCWIKEAKGSLDSWNEG